MRFNRDVVSGGALLLLALVYFGAAWKLPAGRDEPGPGFLPLLLSLSLALTAVRILIGGLKNELAVESTIENRPRRWKPLLAVISTAAFAASFQILGFVLSTWLYTLSVSLLFRRDRPVWLLLVPILSIATIYLLFEIGLGVRLPPSPISWSP